MCDKIAVLLVLAFITFGPVAVSAQDREAKFNDMTAEYTIYYQIGRDTDAIELAKEVIIYAQEAFGPGDPHVAQAQNDLAQLYYYQGWYSESVELHEESLALREKLFEPDSAEVMQSKYNLGKVYLELGRLEEAELFLKEVIERWEEVLGETHIHVALALESYAKLLRLTDRAAQAHVLEARARTIRLSQ